MQAALETMKWPVPKPEFCTLENGVTMGERTEQKRGTTNLGMAVHFTLMKKYCSLSRETIFKRVPAVSMNIS
jgi:hypothetical protein